MAYSSIHLPLPSFIDWLYSPFPVEYAADLGSLLKAKPEILLEMGERTLDNLDGIDRKILAILQKDGRIANADLAKQINLSPTPTLERVRRLERDGFIEGYAALLSPEKMQAAMTAFVEVVLDRTTEDVLGKFAQAAREVPEIVECHMIAGGFDYLLKIRVQDMPAYRQFMGSRLALLPGIRATHTYIAMEKIKENLSFAVPTRANSMAKGRGSKRR